MARRLRIEYPGALHHVINRGNYRREASKDGQQRRQASKDVKASKDVRPAKTSCLDS